MARTTKIFETLAEESQTQVMGMVDYVIDLFKTDTGTDLILLMAALEKLNEIKKSIKDETKALEKAKADAVKLEKKTLGMKYAATLKEGDNITFTYGADATATLPIKKITEKSIQVEYTDDMLPVDYKTAKRSVFYDKIVVPDSFKATLQATA